MNTSKLIAPSKLNSKVLTSTYMQISRIQQAIIQQKRNSFSLNSKNLYNKNNNSDLYSLELQTYKKLDFCFSPFFF